MNKPVLDVIEHWTRLAAEAKQLGLANIPITLENTLMVLAELQASKDYQAAIDILRKRAASEFDAGFKAHHNALIYAANELENAQAFGREVGHES